MDDALGASMQERQNDLPWLRARVSNHEVIQCRCREVIGFLDVSVP